jgi:hypothetical protein
MNIAIFRLDDPGTEIVSRKVTFTIVKPKTPPRIDYTLGYSQQYYREREAYENLYAGLSAAGSSNPKLKAVRDLMADSSQRTRVKLVLSTVTRYVEWARTYSLAMENGRATGILDVAEQVYDQIASRLLMIQGANGRKITPTGGSSRLFSWAMNMRLRYGQVDKALKWCERRIEYQQAILRSTTQKRKRRSAFQTLSNTYRSMALCHLLIDDDTDAWECDMLKADSFKRKEIELKK